MPGMGVGIGLFLVLTVAEVVLLIGIIAGRPWLLFSLETTLSRVLPSFAFSYILVSHLAARELCSVDGGAAFKAVPAGEGVSDTMSKPAILFGALFVQGVMQVLSSTRHALTVTPALTVQLATLLYYIAEFRTPSCGFVSRWPRAQASLVPLHYTLWVCSVSNQVLCLFALERSQVSPQARHTGSFKAGPTHWNCCVALLSVTCMLWSAAIGEAYQGGARAYQLATTPSFLLHPLPPPLHFNHAPRDLSPQPRTAGLVTALLLLLASVSCFYTLIFTGIWKPLRACQMRALRSEDPARKQNASYFLTVSAYLALVWHGFPVIWLANVLGLITDIQCRVGLATTDVLSKFLPPSLYLAIATTP